MIYRQNWLDVRAYLRYCERVKQNDPETVKRARNSLRHLLDWADSSPFPKMRQLDPTFPVYLLTARVDGQARRLAPASIAKSLGMVRQFLTYAHYEWPARYKQISESWINMLQPPPSARERSRLPVHQYFSIEDVLKISRVTTETIRQERGKVAVCMLFLSGMRADALASLPVSSVDLLAGAIAQLPEAGVRTKGRKAAITNLLNIPELFEICAAWDRRVRILGKDVLWYATVTRDGMDLTATKTAHAGRYHAIQDDVKLICERAGVSYLSPHKLRHGHVVYAMKKARTLAELKAISQNVMHETVAITDAIYGRLIDRDAHNLIASLGKGNPAEDLREQLTTLLGQLLEAESSPV